MSQQTPTQRVLFARRSIPALLVLFGVFSLLILNFRSPHLAQAATSSTINFQARLETSAGAIAPDGNYNVEFKLYSASSGGTAEWTEDYTYNSGSGGTDARVHVANGYLSASLGSITPFPNTIDWTQQQWITMNIGGTVSSGTITWDGEMSPRLQLTAVPYAFASGQLQTTNGSNTSTLSIQAPTGGSQTFLLQNQGATGTYNLLTQNASTGIATLGTASTLTGSLAFANAGSANTITLTTAAETVGNATITIPNTAGANDTVCLLTLANCGGVISLGTYSTTNTDAHGATLSAGVLTFQNASATAPGMVGTGAQTFAGNKTFSGSTTLNNTTLAAGTSITITGGNTASRPASPTAGMLYYDSTTNQLLQYNGGKWVSAPRTATKIVAASNSTQAEKDAADYVATGTGDQATINSALTALPAGGGSVYLMEGTYYLSAAISVPDNTTLSGAGAATVITIPNSQNGTYSMIQNSNTTTGTHVFIQNLMIDGNKANQTSGTMNGIYFNGMGGGAGTAARDGGKITNVIIDNLYGSGSNGIALVSSNNNTLTGNTTAQDANTGVWISQSSYNTLTGNTSQGNGSSGFSVSGSSAQYNTLTGNTAQGNQGSGFWLPNSSYTTLSGNSSQGNTSYGIGLLNSNYNTITAGNIAQGNTSYGISLDGSSYNTISANTSQGNGSYAIILTNITGTTASNNNNITGNKIADSGGSTDNNGIYLSGTSGKYASNNSITNNDITDSSCTSTCYAINISNAGNSSNYLANNRFSGDGTHAASINDAGTGTIYANQQDANGNLINKSAGGGFAIGTSTINGTLSLQGGVTAAALSSPAAPTLATAGTAGSTSYTYAVTALDGTGETLASTTTTIATGNATLSGTNYIKVTFSPVAGATSYKIYRTASAGSPATTGYIGTVTSTGATSYTFNDTGLAGSGSTPAANTTGGGTFAGLLQGGTLKAGSSQQFQVDGSGNITTTGTALIKNSSTTAFRVQNAGGSSILTADTTDGYVAITAPNSNPGTSPGVARLSIQSNWTDTAGDNSIIDFGENANNQTNAGRLMYAGDTNQISFGALNSSGTFNPVLSFNYLGYGVTLHNYNSTQGLTIQNDSTSAGIVIKPGSGADRTNAVQIQNAGGTNVLGVDTSSGVAVLGTASTLTGGLKFYSASASGSVTFTLVNPGTTNYTLSIPALTGNDTICTVGAANCTGGSGSGVTSIGTYNSQTASANGAVISGTTLFLQSASGSTPGLIDGNNQSFSGNKTFSGILTASATGGNAIAITGAPTNSATSSLIQIGSAIAGGNTSTNGGTYIGLNAPSSGAGSAADFLNFEQAGTSNFQVTSNGFIWSVGGLTTNGNITIQGASTLSVGGTINTTSGYQFNGTAGATTTCSSGQFLQNQVVKGGISTGGTCAGAVTTVGTFSATSIANGASISGNTITFGPADGTNPGMVTTGNQSFAGTKTFTGGATVAATSTTAFQIQNTGGSTTLLTADTSNMRISIGSIGTSTGQLYVSGSVPTAVLGSVATGTNPQSVAVQGRYAYVTNYTSNTLQIFDVSNPASPTSVGSVATGTNPQSVAVQGRYAYVTNYTSNTLQIFDVSNPASPTSVGSVATGSGPYSLVVQGRYAYVANYNAGSLQIFDVSNPANPSYIGLQGTDTHPASVAVQGRYAYVINNTSYTLKIIDVSNPAGPNIVSDVSTISAPTSVAVQGRYAYVTNSTSNNLQIFDVSNPASPTSVGSVATLAIPYNVAVQGRYAYITTGSGIEIFNISTPASPVNVGNGAGSGNYVAVQGRYAYVTNNSSNTLQTLDLGGTYTQSLEAGSFEVSNVAVQQTLTVNQSASVIGGLQAGGLEVNGNAGVQGNLGVNGSLVLYNSSNANTVSIQSGTTSGSYAITLPTAIGAAGQCLAVSSVAGSTANLGFASCGGGGSGHAKKIILTAEYAGAVLDAASDSSCSSANNGTMTSGYDSVNRTNFYNWMSSTSPSQCYDVVVQVPIPSDWSSWTANPLNVQLLGSNTSNTSYAIQVLNSSGSADTTFCASGYCSPGTLSTSWGNVTSTSSFAGTGYAADGYLTIKVRMSAMSSAYLQLGNITLSYNSAY